MSRKLFLFGLLIILIISGCSNGTNNASEQTNNSINDAALSNSNSNELKSVSMIGWYEETLMEDMIVTLNNKLTEQGYKLEYTFINLMQYNNVLSTQLAAGEGPDIIMDGASFPARIRAGNLVDISNEPFVEHFNEAGLALVTSTDEKLYGVPSYGWYSGVWYNKDIFAQYNLTPPQTFDELLETADMLASNGVQPFGFGLSDADTAWHSLIGYLENAFYHGEEQTTDFDVKFALGEINFEGNLNEYVDEWSEIIKRGYINDMMLGISGEQVIPDFINGKTAMFYGGPWQYQQLKDSGLNFGMFSHVGKNKDERWLVGGPAANFGINKNSKNIEGAKAALSLLASEEVQQTILDSNPGGFSYYMGLEAEIPQEYEDIKEILASGRVGVAWDRWGTNMPAQSMIDEGIKQLQGMVAGVTTTEQFLKALDNKANTIRYKN